MAFGFMIKNLRLHECYKSKNVDNTNKYKESYRQNNILDIDLWKQTSPD